MSTDHATFDMEAALREIIKARIEGHERSLQTVIGASELGTPCVRKLAYKLAQVPPVAQQASGDDKWRPTVGTAVHDWLARMMLDLNEKELESPLHDIDAGGNCRASWCDWFSDATDRETQEHKPRWLVEHHTPIGTIDGQPVPGSLDLFDRLTGTLVDWKIVGPTALKTYRRDRHPGEQYRVQVHLYGRGLARVAGETVRYVAVMFLPSNGELRESFYWEEEYDPEVGKEALARAREVHRLVTVDGVPFGKLKTTDDHCSHCPFFSPGASDTQVACPGDPSLIAHADEGFNDLLPNGAPTR